MILGYFKCDEDETVITEESNEEDLKYFALVLNSPWSYNHESYIVKYNVKDAYSEPDPEFKFKCEYIVIGYDGITSVLYGYGNFPDEALKDCTDKLKEIIHKYNTNNKSF